MITTQSAAEAPDETSVHHLLGAFQRFQGQNERMTSQLIVEHGVGAVELRALLTLRVHGEMTLTRLGQLLCQIPSTITFLVDRLEKAGYLARRPNPTDRRSLLVSLTSDGGEVVADIWERYRLLFSTVVDRDDVGRLTRVFDDLSAAIPVEATR